MPACLLSMLTHFACFGLRSDARAARRRCGSALRGSRLPQPPAQRALCPRALAPQSERGAGPGRSASWEWRSLAPRMTRTTGPAVAAGSGGALPTTVTAARMCRLCSAAGSCSGSSWGRARQRRATRQRHAQRQRQDHPSTCQKRVRARIGITCTSCLGMLESCVLGFEITGKNQSTVHPTSARPTLQCCAKSCGWPARPRLAAPSRRQPQVGRSFWLQCQPLLSLWSTFLCGPHAAPTSPCSGACQCRLSACLSASGLAPHASAAANGSCMLTSAARRPAGCLAGCDQTSQPLPSAAIRGRAQTSQALGCWAPAPSYALPKLKLRRRNPLTCPRPAAASCVSRSWRAAVEACPDLWQHCNLSWRRCRPSDAILARVAPRWAHLRWLSLSGVTGVSDAGLQVRQRGVGCLAGKPEGSGVPAVWPDGSCCSGSSCQLAK